MFLTKIAKTHTKIWKLSPTHFVSNIRHQHRCSQFRKPLGRVFDLIRFWAIIDNWIQIILSYKKKGILHNLTLSFYHQNAWILWHTINNSNNTQESLYFHCGSSTAATENTVRRFMSHEMNHRRYIGNNTGYQRFLDTIISWIWCW